jgi:hypothetical protein
MANNFYFQSLLGSFRFMRNCGIFERSHAIESPFSRKSWMSDIHCGQKGTRLHGYLRCYLPKWNMCHVNRESIHDLCNGTITPSDAKFAISLRSSVSCPVRSESVTILNRQIGTEVRHPLSVEKEFESQTYSSWCETDRWARHILKSPNCAMRATFQRR